MKTIAKRVFVIGIDGAGNAVRDAHTPCIDAFLQDALVTHHGTTAIPTISGECWGALFHGVGPEKHGLTNEIANTKVYSEASPYPSFMKVIRESDPKCELASFSCWRPINKGIIEQSCNCYMDSREDGLLTEKVVKYIKTHDPKAVFVHLDSVDGAGHSYGYRTPKYYDQITEVDTMVGRIIEAIKEQGYYEESAIIICSDHGGGGGHFYSHGSDHYLDSTIFWAYKGVGIEGNKILSEPLHIKDTAAVVADALGLKAPEAWDCKLPEALK